MSSLELSSCCSCYNFSQLFAYLFRLWQYNIDKWLVELLMKPIWNIIPLFTELYWKLMPHCVRHIRCPTVGRCYCDFTIYFWWNDWNVPLFCIHYQNNPNLILLHHWRHEFTYRKILPNLVKSSWFWWILRGILANQKQKNILNE